MNIISSAYAESITVTAAQPPNDFTPIIVLALVAAGVVGFLHFRKKNPKVASVAADVKHTIGSLADKITDGVSTRLHHFETILPAPAPAVSLTPTSPGMKLAALHAKLRAEAAILAKAHEQGKATFPGGYEVVVPPSAPAVPAPVVAPKIVNGVLKV